MYVCIYIYIYLSSLQSRDDLWPGTVWATPGAVRTRVIMIIIVIIMMMMLVILIAIIMLVILVVIIIVVIVLELITNSAL